MKLNDNSIMSFVKHKGEKLINIPYSYLIWLYKEYKPLIEYI